MVVATNIGGRCGSSLHLIKARRKPFPWASPRVRNSSMEPRPHLRASYYLLVEATDGYRALFAWAELDSAFMDKSVYVATKREGKPLSEKDGPFQLVAPGEKRNGRWVR